MAGKVLTLRGATQEQKATRTKVDTILLMPAVIKSWKNPQFQRPLRVNAKVIALAEQIKLDGGVLPGMLTLGILDDVTYRVDGQHRCEAFLLSGMTEGYADVRYHWFDSMSEMAREFELLNSSLVRMRPDDILRAREASSVPLQMLRKRCPFVGYDMIRRGDRSPVLSMSSAIRSWFCSEPEIPAATAAAVADLADRLTEEEVENIANFLSTAYDAWGRETEYQRVWTAHTLTLAMWLYRRTVIAPYSPKTIRLTRDMFRSCLMALTADERHMDWLVGRKLTDRDRSPGYNRMKGIFAKRLERDVKGTVYFPGPSWAHGGGPGKRTAS